MDRGNQLQQPTALGRVLERFSIADHARAKPLELGKGATSLELEREACEWFGELGRHQGDA
jgi:hypothetical protein